MNWIKLKLRNWINSAQDRPELDGHAVVSRSKARLATHSDLDSEEGISITVRSAIGGRIVSFRHYDRKTDRVGYRLYIVPEEQDFERELGKMITLESMRS